MENRVVGILPALVGQALFGSPLVLDKTVAIGVTRPIDPAQRLFDRSPQLGERLVIAGAFDIEPGEQHEQGRCIDTSVILRKRHLAQRSHFTAAHFMQDLSRLGVGQRIDRVRLVVCEPSQDASRKPRVHPQHLQRSDESVAAEGR